MPDLAFQPLNPSRGVPLSQYLKQTQLKTQEYQPTASAGQNVSALLGKDSAYMQRAQTQGLKTAASRGLLNSSLAAGASTAAAIDAVAPIATADAQSRLSQNLQDQSIDWDRERQGLDADLQYGLQNLRGEQETGQITQQGLINRGLQELQGTQALEQLTARGEIDVNLAGINNAAEAQRLREQLEANRVLQVQRGEQEIQQLIQSGDIQGALAQQRALAEMEQLSAQGAQELARLERQIAGNYSLQELAGSQQSDIERYRAEQDGIRQQTQIEAARGLQELQGSQSLAQIQAQGSVQASAQQRAAALDVWTKEQIVPLEQQLASFNQELATEAERIRVGNQALLQSSGAAQNVLANYASGVTAIYSNPDLSLAQQNQAVALLQDTRDTQLAQANYINESLSDVFGVDTGDLNLNMNSGAAGQQGQPDIVTDANDRLQASIPPKPKREDFPKGIGQIEYSIRLDEWEKKYT